MNKKEAAIVAGLSYSTIHRAIKKGELPRLKRGKRVLIRREALYQWMEHENNTNIAA